MSGGHYVSYLTEPRGRVRRLEQKEAGGLGCPGIQVKAKNRKHLPRLKELQEKLAHQIVY